MRSRRSGGTEPPRRCLALPLLGLLFASSGTLADVSLRNPIGTQLPQIARPGKPYSWSFGSDTFVSDNAGHSISYQAQNLPAWVTFDAASRAFTGSPSENDLGSTEVTVVASEEGGQSAQDTFQLLIRGGQGASLNKPLSEQLPTASSLSPSNILPGGEQHLPLGWSFSIGFAGDTFTSPNGLIHTDARLSDGDSLPNWLHFDPTMTLWGVAPTSSDPEGSRFDVVVSASTVEGYSDVTSSVVLVVSAGALTLASPIATVNATAGSMLRYTIPPIKVLLDGRTPDPSTTFDLALDTSMLPWLAFNSSTRELSGNPPLDIVGNSSTKLAVPLQIDSSAQNELRTNLTINVFPSIFTGATLPDVSIRPGRPFDVDLAQFVRSSELGNDSVSITLDPPSAQSWIKVDNDMLRLSGRAPSDAKDERVTVTLTAQDPHASFESVSSASFVLSTTEEPTHKTSTQPDDGRDSDQGGNGLSKTAKIAIAASLGSVGGIILLVLLMICCRRFGAVEDHDRHGRVIDFDTSADDDRTLTEGKSPMMAFAHKGSPIVLNKWRKAKHKDHPSPYLNAGQEEHAVIGVPISVKPPQGGPNNSGSQASKMVQGQAPSDPPKKAKVLSFLRSKPKSGRSLIRDATLNSANRSVPTGSVGLGLEGMAGSDNPYAESRQSIGHSRSYARSSWESDLWLQDESRSGSRQSQNTGTAGSGSVSISFLSGDSRSDSPNEVPVRQGGLVPMRHRNSHINDSPAFNLNHGFDAHIGEAGLDHQARQQPHHLSRSAGDAASGEVLDEGIEAVVTRARKVQVQPTGTIRAPQQVTIQHSQRNTSQRIERLEDTSGAFEDAEDEPDYVEDVVRRKQARSSADHVNRDSYMPGLGGADISAVRFADTLEERSDVRPEETMRVIRPSNVPLPPTPLLPVGGEAESALQRPSVPWSNPNRARPSSGSSQGGRHRQREQHIQAVPGELIRVKVLSGSQAPPIMGGAPDSPGKRSGQRLNYIPVLQDEKYMEYWNTRPEFVEWLTWDVRMQELSGTVPPKFGPLPLSLRVAILARPVYTPSQAPPSPALGSGPAGHSPSKRHSRASSFESTATAVEDEVVAFVTIHIQKANFDGAGATSVELQRGHAF